MPADLAVPVLCRGAFFQAGPPEDGIFSVTFFNADHGLLQFAVTQATVSRDIRELSLTKAAGRNGKPKYVSLHSAGSAPPVYLDRYSRVLREGMVSMTQADNLLVIKTVSGMAMAVAAAVDALEIEEIAGSIAGDDTVMCAVKSAELVPEVMSVIEKEK